jgi:sodium/potassium-transporting ATPase subunit alpha
MAARRLARDGKNVISPPPNHIFRKIFFYIFGGETTLNEHQCSLFTGNSGFGSLLMVASIICFVAW